MSREEKQKRSHESSGVFRCCHGTDLCSRSFLFPKRRVRVWVAVRDAAAAAGQLAAAAEGQTVAGLSRCRGHGSCSEQTRLNSPRLSCGTCPKASKLHDSRRVWCWHTDGAVFSKRIFHSGRWNQKILKGKVERTYNHQWLQASRTRATRRVGNQMPGQILQAPFVKISVWRGSL